ncbi:MAG: hypothetical protein IIA45_03535 [Bacteroidetes bacterium]|nr:hypothetical protein [Bacteroidota bacterium]
MRLAHILVFAIIFTSNSYSQILFSGAIGYFGENITSTGFVLEAEYEEFFRKYSSLPLRFDLGYYSGPDYNVALFDVHKGHRKHYHLGYYFEESAGIGIMLTGYKGGTGVYVDKFGNTLLHGNVAQWSFLPSLTFGIGYNVTKKKKTQNLIWIRPKMYWNLGFRGIKQPYAALQIGYTHNYVTIENLDK